MDERPLPGRYRGRRRVPVPPRGRYAAVVTTAMVGAGVVALGAGAAMPDAKLAPDQLSALGSVDSSLLQDRAEAVERASRANGERGGLATSTTQQAPDLWLLPMHDYTFSSPYGWRWNRMHNGIDLAAPHGTPIFAVHAGTVTLARWNGGYGYAVIIDHGDGVQTLYGHNSELLVSEGQEARWRADRADRQHRLPFGIHLHFGVRPRGSARPGTVAAGARGRRLTRSDAHFSSRRRTVPTS